MCCFYRFSHDFPHSGRLQEESSEGAIVTSQNSFTFLFLIFLVPWFVSFVQENARKWSPRLRRTDQSQDVNLRGSQGMEEAKASSTEGLWLQEQLLNFATFRTAAYLFFICTKVQVQGKKTQGGVSKAKLIDGVQIASEMW